RSLVQRPDLLNGALLTALKELAESLTVKGDYAPAWKAAQLMQRLAERLGDQKGKAAALNLQGSLHEKQGRYEQALAQYQESLRLFKVTGDKAGMAAALDNVGFIHHVLDSDEQALQAYERSKQLFEEAGQPEKVANVLGDIGDAYLRQGRYELAQKYLLE